MDGTPEPTASKNRKKCKVNSNAVIKTTIVFSFIIIYSVMQMYCVFKGIKDNEIGIRLQDIMLVIVTHYFWKKGGA